MTFRYRFLTLCAFLFLFCHASWLFGAPRLPRLFSDGMVVQRLKPTNVWGWADAGAQVVVQLGKRKASAVAGTDGRWRVQLEPQKAGGPFTLLVTTTKDGATTGQVAVSDVYVGDVWLCSGQSNIDTHIERVYPQYPDEIDENVNPRVRLFRVENEAALDAPRDDVRSRGWLPLAKDNAWHFSAIGYFLGLRMAAETGVVQGVIQSSWGGTPIEAWLPMDTVAAIVPVAAAESRLYDDPELTRLASQANARAAARWNQLLQQCDPGVSGLWADPAFDDSGWAEADQRALPLQHDPFCGTYWVRQHIQVDAAHAGQAAHLEVGTLVDADYTYVNGREVGHTGYRYPPRRYSVPAGLLREGDNVLAVRFVNRDSQPSFVDAKPYRLTFADGHRIALSPLWRVHDGVQMPSQPAMPTDLQYKASAEWNGMLSPLAPFVLAGIVWYQGESNTETADQTVRYERELSALMHSWRSLFRQPDLPFAVVQLAGFMAPSAVPQKSLWARLRESQRRAVAADPRAAIVVALDLGEANDIHPLRKKEVAERVAMVFDRLAFGKNDVLLSPQPVEVALTPEQRVVVTFDQPLREGVVHGFELLGADGTYVNVQAEARGCQVILEGRGRGVRYAWKDNPVEADCRARATALPAVPFELTAD